MATLTMIIRKCMVLVSLILGTMMVENLDSGEAFFIIPKKVTVQIINNLNPPQDLALHCKSKTDDVGQHTIKVGEDFSFRFRPKIFAVATLYFCNFRWPTNTSYHYFDIYVQKRDEFKCENEKLTMATLTMIIRKCMVLVSLILGTMMVENLDSGEASFIIPKKVTVQIINNLNPPQDLTLHCKSKTDDVGEHTIKVGEDFSFRFRPNIFAVVTLYFCNFRWPSDISYHYFDIYVQERDEFKCENQVCSWKISKGGACKYDPDMQAYTKCFPWNHHDVVAISSDNSTDYAN
ncbi:S-protein-like protein 5-like [Senna tora]|uniref:S-protein homolog n=1 Tax=Senna tora TaxID=362788 RepID=A0A834WEA6_9FABA|nr:S-protein-like protein 5-like [Senna tora]